MLKGKLKCTILNNAKYVDFVGSEVQYDVYVFYVDGIAISRFKTTKNVVLGMETETGEMTEIPQDFSINTLGTIDEDVSDVNVLGRLLGTSYNFEWIEPLTEIKEEV